MSKSQIASVCPKIMIGANARLLNAKASVAIVSPASQHDGV